MNAKQLETYKNRLLEMRRRLTHEVDHIIDAVHESTNEGSNLSNVPVHLADRASEGVDADLDVLQTEQGMLAQIEEALVRIENGVYGKCTNCGKEMKTARLDALPYTPHCVECASKLGPTPAS